MYTDPTLYVQFEFDTKIKYFKQSQLEYFGKQKPIIYFIKSKSRQDYKNDYSKNDYWFGCKYT